MDLQLFGVHAFSMRKAIAGAGECLGAEWTFVGFVASVLIDVKLEINRKKREIRGLHLIKESEILPSDPDFA